MQPTGRIALRSGLSNFRGKTWHPLTPYMTSEILRLQDPYEVATTSSCRTARASSSTSRPAMGGRAR
jgi:hypothetical protein